MPVRKMLRGFLGSWASSGLIFLVYEEDGFLHGRIEVLKDAIYLMDEDTKRVGQIRLDDKNPDAVMKVRPLVGIEMFSDYRYKGGQCRGIYMTQNLAILMKVR